MIELIKRRDAAQAAFDRFAGQPFVWGKADCVRLSAFALRQAGHSVSLVKGGSYSSLRGALRALERAGFSSLKAAIEAQPGLLEIPAAMAWPGDLVGLPAEEDGPWMALSVALGNGRVLGFQAGVCRVLQPRPDALRNSFAWRV